MSNQKELSNSAYICPKNDKLRARHMSMSDSSTGDDTGTLCSVINV